MELETLFPCSQEVATGQLVWTNDPSTLTNYFFKIRFKIIFHRLLLMLNWFYSSGFRYKFIIRFWSMNFIHNVRLLASFLFAKGRWKESLQSLLSSNNLSFSISCHLFLLLLMSFSTWLTKLVLVRPMGRFPLTFNRSVLLGPCLHPLALHVEIIIVVSIIILSTNLY